MAEGSTHASFFWLVQVRLLPPRSYQVMLTIVVDLIQTMVCISDYCTRAFNDASSQRQEYGHTKTWTTSSHGTVLWWLNGRGTDIEDSLATLSVSNKTPIEPRLSTSTDRTKQWRDNIWVVNQLVINDVSSTKVSKTITPPWQVEFLTPSL